MANTIDQPVFSPLYFKSGLTLKFERNYILDNTRTIYTYTLLRDTNGHGSSMSYERRVLVLEVHLPKHSVDDGPLHPVLPENRLSPKIRQTFCPVNLHLVCGAERDFKESHR